MIRADALTMLQNEFAALAAVTGQSTADSSVGFGPSIDKALRQLGYSAADLATADVPDATTPDYIDLAEYFALVRFADALAMGVDTDSAGLEPLSRRKEYFANVMRLIDERRTRLTGLGYLGAATFQMGYLNLDYLEPGAGE